MSPSLMSTLGLLLCIAPAIVHGVEMVSPMLSRWVVNLVLPLFGPGLPNAASSLSCDEQLRMLDAARAAAPDGKSAAADDYVFLMLFEQRQGSLAFVSIAAGAVYGLSLGLHDRALLHFVFGVMSVLFALVNANHAGVPGLGRHPLVSPHGRNVGILFAPFWAAAAVFNIWAFMNAGA